MRGLKWKVLLRNWNKGNYRVYFPEKLQLTCHHLSERKPSAWEANIVFLIIVYRLHYWSKDFNLHKDLTKKFHGGKNNALYLKYLCQNCPVVIYLYLCNYFQAPFNACCFFFFADVKIYKREKLIQIISLFDRKSYIILFSHPFVRMILISIILSALLSLTLEWW